jgi:hypothetical protein
MAFTGFFHYSSVFIGLSILLSPQIQSGGELKFRKQLIASESAESVGVFDVNGDQNPDIISGSYWYEGPSFLNRHLIGQVERVSEYYDDFATIPMDVDGDEKVDFITGGWFSKTLRWRKNPGNEKEWPLLDIAQTENIETIRAWDVDGNGFEEIVPNTPGSPLIYYTLNRDKNNKPLGTFTKTQVIDKHGHGLGFGDINGDGRKDFIISEGWIEAPADRNNESWKFHPDFDLKDASIPVIVTDINKDGLNDLISGHGHSYGLYWYEQRREGNTIKFIKHAIDPFHSQFHTMEWEDIDDDGNMELITGKRFRAHNGKDPGDNESPGLYYFKWNGESFTKHVISYGPFGEGKGTGIFFRVADLHKTGRKDIVVAGKDGLYVFFHEKP